MIFKLFFKYCKQIWLNDQTELTIFWCLYEYFFMIILITRREFTKNVFYGENHKAFRIILDILDDCYCVK